MKICFIFTFSFWGLKLSLSWRTMLLLFEGVVSKLIISQFVFAAFFFISPARPHFSTKIGALFFSTNCSNLLVHSGLREANLLTSPPPPALPQPLTPKWTFRSWSLTFLFDTSQVPSQGHTWFVSWAKLSWASLLKSTVYMCIGLQIWVSPLCMAKLWV